MNNIEHIFNESNDAEDFATRYCDYLTNLLRRLDKKAIAQFIGELETARNNDKTVFIIGNGGSAATASHMANDIGVDVLKKSGTNRPFRVMSLTDNVPVMTAIANDNGYENLFLDQLKIHYREGDILVAVSASGNSPNVTTAVDWVKSQLGRTIGIAGFKGGRLKEICDLTLLVETPAGEYGPVEDIHMIIDHLVGNYLQYKLSNGESV